MTKCKVTGMAFCCSAGKSEGLLRMSLALVFFFSGVNKFVLGLGDFVNGAITPFLNMWFPDSLAQWFLYAVPFIEVALGALLIFGHRFKCCVLGSTGLFLMILLFGNTITRDFGSLTLTLILILMVALAMTFECCCDDSHEKNGKKEGCCGGLCDEKKEKKHA